MLGHSLTMGATFATTNTFNYANTRTSLLMLMFCGFMTFSFYDSGFVCRTSAHVYALRVAIYLANLQHRGHRLQGGTYPHQYQLADLLESAGDLILYFGRNKSKNVIAPTISSYTSRLISRY